MNDPTHKAFWDKAQQETQQYLAYLDQEVQRSHMTGFWRGLVCGMAIGVAVMLAAEILLR